MHLSSFFRLHICKCTVSFVSSEYSKIQNKLLKTARSLLPSIYSNKNFCGKCWYCLQESSQQKAPGIPGPITIKFQEYYLKEIDCDFYGR